MPNSPAPRIALTPVTQALDVQVVAGKSYVFTADAGTVAIYKWEPIRPKGEHLVLVKTLDLTKVFNPLYGPDDPAHPRPHNVNALLAIGWNWRPDPRDPNDPRGPGVIPCFVEDPFDWRGVLYGGNNAYKSGPDGQPASPPQLWTDQNPVQIAGQPHSRYLPTTSCICTLEDARIAYDDVHDVYCIGTAARNHLWRNLPGYPSDPKATTNPDETHHPAVAAQAKRYIFFGVSKPGADPTLETNYDVAPINDDYADWPLVGVHGDNVVATHAGGGETTFFGPGLIAKGGIFASPLTGAWEATAVGSNGIIPVRDHSPVGPDGRAPVYLIGASLTSSQRMVVNAAFEGAPSGLIKGSATVSLGFAGMDPHSTDAVFHNGFIHVFTSAPGGAARYFKVSVDLNTAANTLTAPQSAVSSELIIQDPQDPETVQLDAPGVEVTKNGDVVVSYRAAGKRANGSEVLLETRYQVLYHNETAFRDYAVLRAADPGSTVATLNRIDFARGWLDPDGLTVWIAGSYASGSGHKAVIGAVKP